MKNQISRGELSASGSNNPSSWVRFQQIQYLCLMSPPGLLVWGLLGLSYLLPSSSGLRAVILPGFGNAQEDYLAFSAALERRGVEVSVVPVERRDWLRIAAGVFSPRFWTSSCVPDELFRFYYDKVNRTVCAAVEHHGSPVTLLCYSAGGWLVRGMLRDNDWLGSGIAASDLVEGVVTLGSPHYPPKSGECMTRGALAHVAKSYPGAYVKEVFYVSVAGTAVRSDPGILPALSPPYSSQTPRREAGSALPPTPTACSAAHPSRP